MKKKGISKKTVDIRPSFLKKGNQIYHLHIFPFCILEHCVFILPELLENPSGEVLNFLDRLDLNPESGVTTTTAITGLSEIDLKLR